jgi:hypothetical protein
MISMQTYLLAVVKSVNASRLMPIISYTLSYDERHMVERLVSDEVHLKRRPVGVPTDSDFQLVKVNGLKYGW